MAWTTPPAFPAGMTAGVAEALQQLSDNLAVIGGAWTAYTPTVTTGGVAVTLGNGSIDGAFKQIDKTIFWRATFVVGSTTSMTAGTVVIGLPANAKSSTNGLAVGSYALASPLGEGTWRNASQTTVQLYSGSTLQTVATLGLVSGSILLLNGTYEGA